MANIQTIEPNSLRVRKGAVDIIDMTLVRDEQFSFILVYKDIATNFVHLRAIVTKTVKEIALELIKIFMNFGPPNIMYYSANDTLFQQVGNFINKIIAEKVNTMQGQSFFCDTFSIRDKIFNWIKEKKCQSWVPACYEVQWTINNTKDNGISPFQRMFTEETVVSHVNATTSKVESYDYILSDLERQLEVDMVIVDRICSVCDSVTFEVHSCDKCHKPVHAYCSQIDAAVTICLPCVRKDEHIEKLRARAREIDILLRNLK